MKDNGISRRHFLYGALLTGAIPAGGFGTVPSLKFLAISRPTKNSISPALAPAPGFQ